MKTKNAKIDLTNFLSSERYPYTAKIPLGDGQTLAIRYRAKDPVRSRAAILAAVSEDLTALGFDPEAALGFIAGQVLKAEALTALKAAFDALDDEATERFTEITNRVEGAGIADILGSWDFDAPIDVETCTALPFDLKAAIVQLSMSAVLPSSQLDFSPVPRI